MKKILLFVIPLFLAICTQSHAVVLSVDPISQSVGLGSQVSFNINVAGLGNGIAMGTYDINLGFNPGLLAYSGIAFGTQIDLFGLGDVRTVTPDNGTVGVFELSLESVSDLNAFQAPAFRLATLSFQTLALGTNSPITLSVNALGDAFGNSITTSLQNSSVSVMAVPEPEEWVLMLLGTWLVGFQIKRKKISRIKAKQSITG
jgi:hypothetical protein